MYFILSDDGTRALEFTSMISFTVSDKSEIVSNPIEQGSFAAYNKIQSPLEVSISVGLQGTAEYQEEQLDDILELAHGLELVSLQTPSAFYYPLNIDSYTYTRNDTTGAYVVDLTLKEIRQVATQVTTSNYKRPQSAETKDTGKTNTEEGGRRSWWKILTS